MNRTELETWLEAYGRAWERNDTRAFTSLFPADVHYHWTPFDEPRIGRNALAEGFDAAVA